MSQVANLCRCLVVALIGLALSSCVVSEKSQGEHKERAVHEDDTVFIGRSLSEAEVDGELMGASCMPIPGKLEQSNCDDGLICVPNSSRENDGTCLVECGAKDNGRLVKRHEKCPTNLRCMMYRDAALSPVGMFCLKGPASRDQACMAPLDADACAHDLSCLPTRSRADDLGRKQFSDYRCKEECSVERPCRGDAQCLYPSYARTERQPAKKDDTMTTCDVNKCAINDPSCPCNKSLGYRCQNLLQGIDVGFCVRTLGVCGIAVSLASP